jgi:hypothetical protein
MSLVVASDRLQRADAVIHRPNWAPVPRLSTSALSAANPARDTMTERQGPPGHGTATGTGELPVLLMPRHRMGEVDYAPGEPTPPKRSTPRSRPGPAENASRPGPPSCPPCPARFGGATARTGHGLPESRTQRLRQRRGPLGQSDCTRKITRPLQDLGRQRQRVAASSGLPVAHRRPPPRVTPQPHPDHQSETTQTPGRQDHR